MQIRVSSLRGLEMLVNKVFKPAENMQLKREGDLTFTQPNSKNLIKNRV